MKFRELKTITKLIIFFTFLCFFFLSIRWYMFLTGNSKLCWKENCSIITSIHVEMAIVFFMNISAFLFFAFLLIPGFLKHALKTFFTEQQRDELEKNGTVGGLVDLFNIGKKGPKE